MTTRKRKLPTASEAPKSTPLPPLSKEVAEQFQQYLASHVELCPHDNFTFLDDELAFRELCASIQVDIFNINEKFEDILQRRHSLDLNLLERARLALVAPAAPAVDSLPSPVPDASSVPPSDTFPSSSVAADHPESHLPHSCAGSVQSASAAPSSTEPSLGRPQEDAATASAEPSAAAPGVSISVSPSVSPIYLALVTSSDVRFKLPRVLVKAFNTMGDREKFQRVLDKYFLPTVSNRHRPQPFKFNPIGPKLHMEMLGTGAIASYYDAFANSIPDLVYDLQDVHWKFLPDGSCALIMSFLIYGTKVFHTSVETYDSVVVRSDGEAVYSTTTAAGATSASAAAERDMIVEAIESLATDIDGDDVMILSPPTDAASSAATSVVGPPLPPPSLSSHTSTSEPSLESDSNIDGDLDMDAIVTGIERIRLQGVLTEAKPIMVIGTMTFLTRPDGKVYDMDCVFHNRLYPS